MSVQGSLQGLHVHVQSDNFTMVFYVNRSAGHTRWMTTAATALWCDLDWWGVTLLAEYLLGHKNVVADALSHRPLTGDDWVLQ